MDGPVREGTGLNCPACSHALESLMVGDLLIDVCTQGCGGAWFNPFELERMLRDDRAAAESFVRGRTVPEAKPSEQGARQCPRCQLPMMRRLANPTASTHVYECPGCGGRWVDGDDLTAMLQDESTSEDRQKALERRFYEEFGEPLAQEQHREARKRRRMTQVGDVFWALGPAGGDPIADADRFRKRIERDG